MKVMGAGLDGRHVVHGGLHLPPAADGGTRSSARTCSRSARSIAAGKPVARNPSARHRRQGRPGAARVRRAGRARRSTRRSIDLGNRFRLIVNEVDVVQAAASPAEAARGPRRLGVPARLQDRAAPRWIHAGGAHHTGFSYARHDASTSRTSPRSPASNWSSSTRRPRVRAFKAELRHNEVYYALARGFHG